jgi:glycerophosphoryl diester phosphodiesterase
MRQVLRIGHRGAAGYAPENTLASIEKAISFGLDFVEVDVQRTNDGHLVILHDDRVDRTTNGTGLLSEMPLLAVRKLDAGAGQAIPTLGDVLKIANGRIGLILEIKVQGLAAQPTRRFSDRSSLVPSSMPRSYTARCVPSGRLTHRL